MKVIHAYIKGWTQVLQHKRIWGLIYLSNFVLALLSAMPISGFLGRKLGYSTSLGNSLPGFDYTFIGEILQQFNLQVDRILDQTYFNICIFLIVSVFLMGGALSVFQRVPGSFSWTAFWQGCRKFFWRLLRLNIYFLLLHTVVFFFFAFLFSAYCDGLNPFNMESEKQMIDAIMILGPIYLLVFTLITLIHDYAKIHLVRRDERWLYTVFGESFMLVFKNIGRFGALYLLNMFTFLLVFGLYWWGSSFFESVELSSITILFLIGQIFIILRVAIRMLFWSSATYLYQWTRPQHVT